MTRNAYTPLDVLCPPDQGGCGAMPGRRCRSLVISSRPELARPHAARVTAARTAQQRRGHPRLPSNVTDAWTCPDCGRSYWPPAEWEPELWPAVRLAAQQLHGRRHQLERGDAHVDPEPVEPVLNRDSLRDAFDWTDTDTAGHAEGER